MKKIFFLLVIFSVNYQQLSAQDIFGRAKNPDSTYLNPNDFNQGELIGVDTSGGSKVFVGVSNPGGGRKFIAEVFQAGTGAPIIINLLSNTTGASITSIVREDVGIYNFIFSSNIFSGKNVYIVPKILYFDFEGMSIQVGHAGPIANSINSSDFKLGTYDANGDPADGILSSFLHYLLEINIYD